MKKLSPLLAAAVVAVSAFALLPGSAQAANTPDPPCTLANRCAEFPNNTFGLVLCTTFSIGLGPEARFFNERRNCTENPNKKEVMEVEWSYNAPEPGKRS